MSFVIAADHPSLPGHFPGRPLVPGVVLLERVLEAIEAGHGELVGVRLPQVKFLQPLLPGQRARVELERVELECVELERAAAGSLRWRFRVLRDEAVLARGEVLADAAGAPP